MLRVSFLTALLCFCLTSTVFGTGGTSLEKKETRKSRGSIEREYAPPTGIIPLEQGDCDAPREKTSLGTRINCGTVGLDDISLIAIYWIDWIASFAGATSVLMLVLAGWKYVIGSTMDDKEQGKKTIIYAASGLFVLAAAWKVIALTQGWITSIA